MSEQQEQQTADFHYGEGYQAGLRAGRKLATRRVVYFIILAWTVVMLFAIMLGKGGLLR